MGWLFTEGQTKRALIEHLVNGNGLATHKKCVRGNTLWAIQSNPKYPEHGKFIVCYMMGSDAGYGWGYKDVSESMGPVDDSCPVGYLDEVPMPADGFAGDWRKRVRARAKEREHGADVLRRAMPGDRISTIGLSRPTEITLVSKRPLLGADGVFTYRLKRKHLGSILPPRTA